MFRFSLVVFLSCLFLEVFAQEGKIQKSTEIVVIRGESYYLHTVLPGQTLYSICKAYNVSVENLKKLNGKKEDKLSLYEVLKVPYEEFQAVQDNKYYYHKVVKGETLYSIARYYGMKPKKLIKHNSNYSTYRPLAVGAVVKVPLSDMDRSRIPVEKPGKAVADTDSKKLAEQKVEKAEDIKEPLTLKQNQKIAMDTLKEDTFKTLEAVTPPLDSFVRVALVLPFHAQKYPAYRDSLPEFQTVKISARTGQFLNFYEGILLAVDSLKKMGRRIHLHVFDSEKNPMKMQALADKLEQLAPDLIIGPVYSSVAKVLADSFENKNTPIVFPLSSRGENLGNYQNIVQVNPSFAGLITNMAVWLNDKGRSANIIHIHTYNEGADAVERQVVKEQFAKVTGMRSFTWNLERITLDSLKSMLAPERENIIVIPTGKEADVSKILPVLTAFAANYRLSVIGLPEWQQFSSIDFENFYKLDTKLFTYCYVDYASNAAKCLAEKYRKYFYSEPSTLVYKAFDMGMYFIELADTYRYNTLNTLSNQAQQDKDFSLFRFKKMPDGAALENQAFYIVHFSSEYQIKIEKLP